MTQSAFDRMCNNMPHLNPVLTSHIYRFSECEYDEKESTFSIIKKDFYEKSNGKKCYVETIVDKIIVPRYMVTMPKGFSYYWVIKFQYRRELLEKHIGLDKLKLSEPINY